ncbi:hypothetical protein NIES2100_79350 [Calothrix sp. NIES-2100]|uniref:lysylphosphatidylglycerol synthase transmembrane domain-containing protein n=1 Tax=Calothrix sp. NIES-2100 TaxID=1954172 RepID=UPI000B5FD428|nr:hypothetical protein NIES2100_79350 [Calothrix sp. NIES-2100]
MSWKRCLQILPSFVGIVLLGVTIWVIEREIQQYPPGEIWRSLSSIPTHKVVWAIALTFLNYIVLTGYDQLAVQSIRHPLPYRKTILVSVIGIPISNIIGFSVFSDGAIRYRFYTIWGLSGWEVAQVIAFCHLSFWLGLFAVSGVIFIVEPLTIPSLLHLPFHTVHPLGGFFLSIIATYLLWNSFHHRSLQIKRWTIPQFPLRLCLAQIAIASLDWVLSATVLYVMLPPTSTLSLKK